MAVFYPTIVSEWRRRASIVPTPTVPDIMSYIATEVTGAVKIVNNRRKNGNDRENVLRDEQRKKRTG